MNKIFASEKGYIGKGVAQVAMCNGIGHISGQLSCDLATGKAIHDSIGAQTERAILCIQGILEDLGLTLEHVMKCNVYLSSMELFDEMNAVYLKYFGTENPPARQTVTAQVWDGLDIEISCEFYY